MVTRSWSQRDSRGFSDVFDTVLALERTGGPTPAEDASFRAWLDRTWDQVAAGLLDPAVVHGFFRDRGREYLERSLPGRALAKPYGYAGDFTLIDDIYCQHKSPDPRFRNWDRFCQALPVAQAVRNRARYLAAEA